jgi:hypothetical protein
MFDNGKAVTTKKKEGRVYEFLKRRRLPCIVIGQVPRSRLVVEGAADESWQQAERTITLWDAVASHYTIRNEVAHEGRFDLKKAAASARRALALEFFRGSVEFLEPAMSHAVRSEVVAAMRRQGRIT